jgi:hypothetical protein
MLAGYEWIVKLLKPGTFFTLNVVRHEGKLLLGMLTKRNIIIGLILILLLGLVIYAFFGKNIDNEIIVEVDNSLSKDKVRIEYGFYSINSGNDENLVKFGLKKAIFKNNHSYSFETICGENDFYITYDNQHYTIIRHFIPNDFYNGIPKPHQYIFNLKNNNGQINLYLNIKGPDGEEFQRSMMPISKAKEYIWGSVIH